MAKDKENEFIEKLVDAIMGKDAQEHPSFTMMNRICREFNLLMGMKWNKLFQEYKESSGCHIEGCVTCAYTYKQNMRLLKFIREIMEPHKAAYVELVNDLRLKNEAFERLQAETHSQNREHN